LRSGSNVNSPYIMPVNASGNSTLAYAKQNQTDRLSGNLEFTLDENHVDSQLNASFGTHENNNFYRYHKYHQQYQASPYLGGSSNNSSATNTPLCMPYTSHLQGSSNIHGVSGIGMGNMTNGPSHSSSPFSVGSSNPYYMNGNTPKYQTNDDDNLFVNRGGNGAVLNAHASNFMLPPSISNAGTTASSTFFSTTDSQGRSLHLKAPQYQSPYFGSVSSTSSFSNGNSVENTPVFVSREWRNISENCENK